MSEQETLELLREGMDTTPLRAGDLPRLDLYMDQVLALLEERFQPGQRTPEDRTVTKTIINNYSKARLLRKPVGKKYTPEHLLVITLIQALKQSLSLEDIRRLLEACPEFAPGEEGYDPAAVAARYGDFERMKLAQEELAGQIAGNMASCGADDVVSQVMYLANLAGALTLTAERLVDTLPGTEKSRAHRREKAEEPAVSPDSGSGTAEPVLA